MIESKSFGGLPDGDLRWLKTRRHFSCVVQDGPSPGGWDCMCLWDDKKPRKRGFCAGEVCQTEIITYVCQRDALAPRQLWRRRQNRRGRRSGPERLNWYPVCRVQPESDVGLNFLDMDRVYFVWRLASLGYSAVSPVRTLRRFFGHREWLRT